MRQKNTNVSTKFMLGRFIHIILLLCQWLFEPELYVGKHSCMGPGGGDPDVKLANEIQISGVSKLIMWKF